MTLKSKSDAFDLVQWWWNKLLLNLLCIFPYNFQEKAKDLAEHQNIISFLSRSYICHATHLWGDWWAEFLSITYVTRIIIFTVYYCYFKLTILNEHDSSICTLPDSCDLCLLKPSLNSSYNYLALSYDHLLSRERLSAFLHDICLDWILPQKKVSAKCKCKISWKTLVFHFLKIRFHFINANVRAALTYWYKM